MIRYFNLILLLPLFTQAQYVFPTYGDSVSWNVLECYWGSCTTEVYTYQYDTLFCGETYSVIDFNSGNKWDKFYIRSDSGRVYVRHSIWWNNPNKNCSKKEQLVYDFNLSLYDTVYIDAGLQKEFVVDSIDTVIINGVKRKRMRINEVKFGYLYGYKRTWIQGIGTYTHPLYFISANQVGSETDWQTLCVDSGATKIFGPNVYPCEISWFLSTEQYSTATQEQPSIVPNPNYGSFTFNTTSAETLNLTIYNLTGQTIFTTQLNPGETQVQLPPGTKPGMYILRYSSGEENGSVKFIVE